MGFKPIIIFKIFMVNHKLYQLLKKLLEKKGNI